MATRDLTQGPVELAIGDDGPANLVQGPVELAIGDDGPAHLLQFAVEVAYLPPLAPWPVGAPPIAAVGLVPSGHVFGLIFSAGALEVSGIVPEGVYPLGAHLLQEFTAPELGAVAVVPANHALTNFTQLYNAPELGVEGVVPAGSGHAFGRGPPPKDRLARFRRRDEHGYAFREWGRRKPPS